MTLNRGVVIVICALLPLAGSLPAGAHSQNLRLEPAQPVARDLAVGETHSLAIALAADEWLSLRIEQRGVDVTATLVGPDDLTRTSADDAKGRQGVETVDPRRRCTRRLPARHPRVGPQRGRRRLRGDHRRAPPADGRRAGAGRGAAAVRRQRSAFGSRAATTTPSPRRSARWPCVNRSSAPRTSPWPMR